MTQILIVDDEMSNLQQIKELLGSFGYTPVLLSKAEFLFKRLETAKVELILLDVNMPGVDGMTALKQLKGHEIFSKIPVIMLTADTSDQVMEKCFECGATDFITKPVNKSVLRARIGNALNSKANTEQLEVLVKERTAKLEEMNKAFQLFVPRQFLRHVFSQKEIHSGQFEEVHVTILFADIRSYTNHVEQMSPEENFDFLNDFFHVVEPPISENQGFVDKFIGDAVMAIFDQEDSADQALKAAIEMQAALIPFNEKRKEKGFSEVFMGIGINTGPVMMGALGSKARLSSTVIGDHVNLASRVEALTKRFNSKILITHHTFGLLKSESYLTREIDTMRVKGRATPVMVYEVFDSDPPALREKKQKTEELLFVAIALYKLRHFPEALDVLNRCLEKFPQDVIVLNYLQRCRYFHQFPPEISKNETWEGMVNDSEILIDQDIRRRWDRFQIAASVTLYPHGTELHYSGEVEELSMRGMSFKTDFSTQIGEILFVEIYFKQLPEKQHQQAQQLLGRVVWLKKNHNAGNGFEFEVGLESLVMTLEQEDLFEKALFYHRARNLIEQETHTIHDQQLSFEPKLFPSSKEFPAFKAGLLTLVQEKDIRCVVFNLKDFLKVTSETIGYFVSLHKTLQRHNAQLVFCEVRQSSMALFKVSNVDKIIPIFPTEDDISIKE